ncbi:hypothetical protein SlGVgp129 [Spodoptera litura granulovirus]|uniref:Uncharacterized protein n=1 Tax=Spodoptera litura granulovirus TaxID=359919 RepID=A5IZY1_9BBAC|nr:hypothetical protein SlGVgp129 [Spodoptera litura granulovirus]ABQ52072.1 hypothetical protein SlGVgp129 [Spodoptera litura granulovirus]
MNTLPSNIASSISSHMEYNVEIINTSDQILYNSLEYVGVDGVQYIYKNLNTGDLIRLNYKLPSPFEDYTKYFIYY